MNRPQQTDRESTSVVVVEHKVLPTRVAVGMIHRQSDARTGTDLILACMGSFEKNLDVAIGTRPLQHQRPFAL